MSSFSRQHLKENRSVLKTKEGAYLTYVGTEYTPYFLVSVFRIVSLPRLTNMEEMQSSLFQDFSFLNPGEKNLIFVSLEIMKSSTSRAYLKRMYFRANLKRVKLSMLKESTCLVKLIKWKNIFYLIVAY